MRAEFCVATATGRLEAAASSGSSSADRLEEAPEEPPDLGWDPEEATGILTVLTGYMGVLTAVSAAGAEETTSAALLKRTRLRGAGLFSRLRAGEESLDD